jgi:hypothetical protein
MNRVDGLLRVEKRRIDVDSVLRSLEERCGRFGGSRYLYLQDFEKAGEEMSK